MAMGFSITTDHKSSMKDLTLQTLLILITSGSNTTDISKKTRSQESATSFLRMESNLRATVKITRFRVKENSKVSMALLLKAFGKTTCLYIFRMTLRFNLSLDESSKKYFS
jgi:hypothetical protein